MIANVLSIDAIVVGVFWQFVFTIQFCRRVPSAYEAGVIGLSIWLVYTADRLFDSLRLDTSRLHSARHRFHYEFRNPLIACWFVALVVDTALVISHGTDAQLRWGCAAVAVVVAYVAGVQFTKSAPRWFPKELQAGLVFAFGVSLTAWSIIERPSLPPLMISTVTVGLLFAANCLTIASLEIELDTQQNFASFARDVKLAPAAIPSGLLLLLCVSVGLMFLHWIPRSIGGCLIASGTLLLVVAIAANFGERWPRGHSNRTRATNVLVSLADVALMIPPLALFAMETAS